MFKAFFSDGQGEGGQAPVTTDAKTETKTEAQPVAFEALPPSWQAEIKSLRDEAAANRAKKADLEKQQAEAEAKRLAEAGEFKTLAEKRQAELEALKPKAELADKLLGQMDEANKAKIARIPEGQRKLIPTGLDTLALSQWLDAALEVLVKPVAPSLDGGRTGVKGDVSEGIPYNPTSF
ncbi:MAG: hypothetical protein MUF38_05795 [Anaerolineae bacterium]|jgi:uncharacterized membrane protein YqiK|nr:hypothetical protein [Anaerolineae bacterium]